MSHPQAENKALFIHVLNTEIDSADIKVVEVDTDCFEIQIESEFIEKKSLVPSEKFRKFIQKWAYIHFDGLEQQPVAFDNMNMRFWVNL